MCINKIKLRTKLLHRFLFFLRKQYFFLWEPWENNAIPTILQIYNFFMKKMVFIRLARQVRKKLVQSLYHCSVKSFSAKASKEMWLARDIYWKTTSFSFTYIWFFKFWISAYGEMGIGLSVCGKGVHIKFVSLVGGANLSLGFELCLGRLEPVF